MKPLDRLLHEVAPVEPIVGTLKAMVDLHVEHDRRLRHLRLVMLIDGVALLLLAASVVWRWTP
jgi:hypothetical protein